MTTYSLPSIPYRDNIIHLIEPNFSNNISFQLNPTLSSYLSKIKTQIDSCQSEWDKCKKLTNPYEYIHTSVPNTKQAVCKCKPLSRSFYKMIEIYNLMYLDELLNGNRKIFYLAEGPGGFIEALISLRNNSEDKHYAISLINNEDLSIPGWNKSKDFLDNNPNITLEKGIDKTGNLFNPDTLMDIYKRHKNSVDLVTADGGFNFSSNFNDQETVSTNLIICQIAYAIAVQKKNGTAIIKFFDTFTDASVDMVYFLLIAYKDVSWVKPCTSRYANSERYAVCKGFRLKNIGACISKFKNLLELLFKSETIKPMTKLLTCDIPYIVINKLEEYNAIFGQQQIESIANTLNLIDNPKYDKLDAIKKCNIGKCIAWCNKYKLPYHRSIQPTNVFLGNRVSST